jgi:hypothetical protein
MSVGTAWAVPSERSVEQAACRDSVVRSPLDGDVLQGVVPVYGSARIDDFNFYKLEFATLTSPDSWSAVSTTKNAPVLSGLLDVWDTTRVTDGTYLLKLTTVDSVGQEVCRHTVANLAVANRGTPTPTETATPAESPTPTVTVVLAPDEATVAPTPEPTVEPIVPATTEGGFGGTVLSNVSGTGIFDAFFKGFVLTLAVATIALVLHWLRRA